VEQIAKLQLIDYTVKKPLPKIPPKLPPKMNFEKFMTLRVIHPDFSRSAI